MQAVYVVVLVVLQAAAIGDPVSEQLYGWQVQAKDSHASCPLARQCHYSPRVQGVPSTDQVRSDKHVAKVLPVAPFTQVALHLRLNGVPA